MRAARLTKAILSRSFSIALFDQIGLEPQTAYPEHQIDLQAEYSLALR